MQHRKEPEGEHSESISAPKSPSLGSILRAVFEGILPQNTIRGGKQDICLLGHLPLLIYEWIQQFIGQKDFHYVTVD